jgi:hypothetical protein
MDAGKLTHAAGVGLDAFVAALGAAVLSLSFLQTIDLVVRILVGLATLFLIILRIRAHWRSRPGKHNGPPFLGAFAGAVLLLLSSATRAAVVDLAAQDPGALEIRAPSLLRTAAPQDADPALGPWFRSLTNPATGASCCAESDGHILRDRAWRQTASGYQVRIADHWWDVPADSVLEHVPNPTGGAVAFYPPANDEGADMGPGNAPRIYCFVRPVES